MPNHQTHDITVKDTLGDFSNRYIVSHDVEGHLRALYGEDVIKAIQNPQNPTHTISLKCLD